MKKDKAWVIEQITDFAEGESYPISCAADFALDVIEEMDIPEAVAIPKEMAEQIEQCKEAGMRLNVALSLSSEDKLAELMGITIDEVNEVYARAWLDGYEIEKEPLFYALIKGHELKEHRKYWAEAKPNAGVFNNTNQYNASLMTKNKWNALGINDSNADFVEVAE